REQSDSERWKGDVAEGLAPEQPPPVAVSHFRYLVDLDVAPSQRARIAARHRVAIASSLDAEGVRRSGFAAIVDLDREGLRRRGDRAGNGRHALELGVLASRGRRT